MVHRIRKEVIQYFKERDHKNIKITQMPEAWSNLHTYKVSTNKNTYILKMFTDFIQNEKKVALREYKLLKLFKTQTPRVFSLDTTSFNHPAILMEFVKGNTLNKKRWTLLEVKQVSRLLAKIHSTKITPQIKSIFNTTQPKMPLDWKGAKAWAKKVKDKKISKRLVRILNKIDKAKKLAYAPTICHGDVKHLNILNSKRGLKLVDWESAYIGDPAADFAQLFFLSDYWKLAPTKNQRKTLIKEYKKLRKETNNFEDRINYWYSNKDIIELLWRVRHSLYITGKELGRINKNIKKLEKKWFTA